MTDLHRKAKTPRVSMILPYGRGVAAVMLGLGCYLLITVAILFGLDGSFGKRLTAWIPAIPVEIWSPVIAAALTYWVHPFVIPAMQRLSICRNCGKSTLVTSENLGQWDIRANPDQRTAGARRFWPERHCSECHADLCLKA